MVRTATINDITQILEIYNYYIKETVVTFEIEQLDNVEMTRRFNETIDKYEWIVWQDERNNILGYAYYNSFRPRAAYQYSVESTVYLRHDSRAKGIGKQLYQELLKRFNKSKYRVILGTISLPNEPSPVA
ncbi:GNAT family N-acetyltransferase [Sporocytophaga myxococcoides]|uniref:GNAT family N-acetyltransferase n=1 Tax=Sporocytophaga myxococcoides TaxID=153721 RepID=UPI00040C5AA0|nr:GNAT family N-acetyltransferase [Sporocytophaga myxococcoides]